MATMRNGSRSTLLDLSGSLLPLPLLLLLGDEANWMLHAVMIALMDRRVCTCVAYPSICMNRKRSRSTIDLKGESEWVGVYACIPQRARRCRAGTGTRCCTLPHRSSATTGTSLFVRCCSCCTYLFDRVASYDTIRYDTTKVRWRDHWDREQTGIAHAHALTPPHKLPHSLRLSHRLSQALTLTHKPSQAPTQAPTLSGSLTQALTSSLTLTSSLSLSHTLAPSLTLTHTRTHSQSHT